MMELISSISNCKGYYVAPVKNARALVADDMAEFLVENYEAIKKTNEALINIEDEQLKPVLEKGYNLFNNNLNVILSILNQGGSNE